MDCSIVIVSWNVRDKLRLCLESIFRQTGCDYEVFVVDNASADGSDAMVRSDFPKAMLMQMRANAGFARASNRGIAEARGRYVFILNPDSELPENTLRTLVSYGDAHPDVALISPRIQHPDGSLQLGSVRTNPTLASQLLIKLMRFPSLWRRSAALRSYFMVDFDPRREQSVEQVMGAAMFLRRDVLSELGGFDERFFIWFEDVDLCRRLQLAGKSIIYYPGATVVHHGGSSFRQRAALRKQWMYNRSLIQYFLKYGNVVGAGVVALLLPFNVVLVAVLNLLRPHDS